MLAQKNEFISEASATIYELSQEEKVRLQCEAREDFYRQQKGTERRMEKLTVENQKLISEYEKLLGWAREHGYKD